MEETILPSPLSEQYWRLRLSPQRPPISQKLEGASLCNSAVFSSRTIEKNRVTSCRSQTRLTPFVRITSPHIEEER